MNELPISPDGEAAIADLMAASPELVRPYLRNALLRLVPLVAARYVTESAGKDTVLEAARLLVPLFHWKQIDHLDDPARYRQVWVSPKEDINAYLDIPVTIRRWQPVKPSRSGPCHRVVAVCASPRRNGNTHAVLQSVLDGAGNGGAVTELIMLDEHDIRPCNDCGSCMTPTSGIPCTLLDDLTNVIFPEIKGADALVIGFPIYWGREIAQAAIFCDRLRSLYFGDLRGQRGMVVGVWGYQYPDAFDHVIARLAATMAAVGVEPVEALSVSGFHGKPRGLDQEGQAKVRHYPEQLAHAYEAGKNLVTANQTH